MNAHHTAAGADVVSGSLLTSIVTGLALVMPTIWTGLEKLVVVFVLAVVAECGRRLVSLLWKPRK